MLGDPRDRPAYRIAIASIGLALAIVLAGVCTIVAVGKCVPDELWFVCSAAGGLLAGTLIPFSLYKAPSSADAPDGSIPSETSRLIAERALALLVLAGAVAACLADPLPVQMLGVALGGLLVGLLIPSPSRWDR